MEDWAFSSDKSQVDLSYRLNDDKAVTRLQAHAYLRIAPDDVLADTAIELTDPAGVADSGVQPVTPSKGGAHRLAGAAHDSVSVLVGTNYIQYLDGSGVIID